jgi:inhibitor of KinA
MALIDGWTLSRVGDATLVLECEQRIDPDLNACVLQVAHTVRQRARPGVLDVVESYCAVTVHFDPLKTDTTAVALDLEVEVANAQVVVDESQSLGRRLTVPVCYGGRHGPDLEGMAAFAACSEAEVIARHSGEVYRVYMLGFLPGFAYMGVVPAKLAMPRRLTPRLNVPIGSVGVAGQQTGVYPLATPGGWQLIGRTPLLPFDSRRSDPFLFRAADMIQFEPVDPERFDELAVD